MRRVMTETWHNYFLDPTSAPDPDPAWLDGCSAEAMLATDRAISRTDRRRLDRLAGLDVPVLVLYGEYDIFGDAIHIVRDRFPRARQVTLSGSGHLHWLQQPDAYGDQLRAFYRRVEQPVRTGSRSKQSAASLQEQRVAPAAIETANALADSDDTEAARLV
jgi:pimeloyl-ACP methyl ester carboxylesterase